jgi:pimeloyl-ACP methyl ester carboxylesterase
MPTVQSGGVPIHYEVIGRGQPIVLVHGFSSSFDSDWQLSGWVDFLVGEGRQVIGRDCRGHGNSGKPHSPQAYAGNRIPDDVVAVMDAAGIERADIMGYSMGALVTLNLLSRHAERFTSVVVGGVGLPKPTTDPQRRARLAAALEASDPATIIEPTALRFRQAGTRTRDWSRRGSWRRQWPVRNWSRWQARITRVRWRPKATSRPSAASCKPGSDPRPDWALAPECCATESSGLSVFEANRDSRSSKHGLPVFQRIGSTLRSRRPVR